MDAFRLPSGAPVSRLGQGAWQIGEDRRKRAAEQDALRVGLELGLNLIDTAEMYGNGGSEELIADVIAGRREQVYLVSKVLPENASRRGTIAACEHSLKRLQDRLSRPVSAALARLGAARGDARSVHGAARPRLDPPLRRQQLRRRRSRGSASATGRRRHRDESSAVQPRAARRRMGSPAVVPQARHAADGVFAARQRLAAAAHARGLEGDGRAASAPRRRASRSPGCCGSPTSS